MIAKLLEKAIDFLLGPPPPPKAEPAPDPRGVAAEMRACARWLNHQADRLDPLVIPELTRPPVGLPPRWNVFLDDTGGDGKVRRAGSRVRSEPPPLASGRPTVSADDSDPEAEKVEEIADRLEHKFGKNEAARKIKENAVINKIFDAHPGEEEIHLNQDETIALMEAIRPSKKRP